jgi:hypothetical protein
VSPNVADFVEQRDDIFVHIQRLRREGEVRPTRTGNKGAGRLHNTDIVAALVR